jgi:ubiquitin carboxyl-terminal hydrolase 36/42
VVMEIFGGALQSQVKCLSCGTESNKVDEIMDISLDVLHSNSLKDALQRYFQSELLDGQNKYKCERYIISHSGYLLRFVLLSCTGF